MSEYNDIEFVKNDTENSAGAVSAGNGKKKLIIVIVILVIAAAGLFIGIDMSKGFSSANADQASPYIGELYIHGTIGDDSTTYNQSWILKQIREMKKSKSNKGMILYVNSPGGAVYQSDEIYTAIRDYQNTTKRPVYSYYAEYAASGAYYISACSDHIAANKYCTTGSIGVYVGPLFEVSGLLEKAGVKAEIIRSGENKAMGSSYVPLTDEQRQIYQDQVDEIYNNFVGIVAEGRGMDEEYVRMLADGRAYTASQALNNGLIDEICSQQELEKKIKDDTKVNNIVKFRYHREETLIERMIGAAGALEKLADMKDKSEEQMLLEYLEDMDGENVGFWMLMQK